MLDLDGDFGDTGFVFGKKTKTKNNNVNSRSNGKELCNDAVGKMCI